MFRQLCIASIPSLLLFSTGCPPLCEFFEDIGLDLCGPVDNGNVNTNDNSNSNGNSNSNDNSNANENDNSNSNDNNDGSIAGDNVFGLESGLVLSIFSPPAIVAFDGLAGLSGDVEPAATLTREAEIKGFDFNGDGELIVLTDGRLEIFADAAAVAAGEPSRAVTHALLADATGLAHDRIRDVAYVTVTRAGDRTIFAFGPTESAEFDGEVAPIRRIAAEEFDASDVPFFTNVSAAGDLYVSRLPNDCAPDICLDPVLHVFEAAVELDGEVSPDRSIAFSPVFGGLFQTRVDADDNLIFNGLRIPDDPNSEGIRGIGSVPAASQLNGPLPAAAYVSTDFDLFSTFAIDNAGTAYVGSATRGVVVFNNIAGREGEAVEPDRQFQATPTPIGLPTHIVIIE